MSKATSRNAVRGDTRDLRDKGYGTGRTGKDFVSESELSQGYTDVPRDGLGVPNDEWERETWDSNERKYVDKYAGGFLARRGGREPREA